MPPRVSRKAKQSAVAPKRTANHVYGELIAEAGPAIDDRPLKRPRLGNRHRLEAQKNESVAESAPRDDPTAHTQALLLSSGPVTDTEGESLALDDEDSDLEFEDVFVQPQPSAEELESESDRDRDISITISTTPGTATHTPRRNVQNKVHKSVRILAHKAHFVALLGHCMIANSRCNDYVAQKRVRRLLSEPIRVLLTPDQSTTQFQRNHSLMKGLQRAVDAFKGAYKVTASGTSRAVWRAPQDLTARLAAGVDNANYQSFKAAAKTLSGSQDTGAQLFCAMLRSVGVVTRLVCSLQVLPLSVAQARQGASVKQHSTVALTITPNRNRTDTASSRQSPAARTVKKLNYPIFWVEIFDAAYQKWIPVDPIVTRTIKKPSQLEPPASYELNQMAYVIAFDSDGSAKDVTRRYARSFNAKTRRVRLESQGPDEAKWLRKVMRLFRTLGRGSDRTEIEDAELSRREASEGMPGNILDFAGHPIYALERHMKRNEVIHPRREVGKVNAGTSANPKLESVFRRQDVHICRSADQWYRLGRAVRSGIQPLKLVPARRQAERDDTDSAGESEQHTVGLYSLAQTELYIPDRVSRGRVPRNAFGNVDVYVPSMVPPGASHVRHQLAKHAAALLEIDAADAVVGFKFTGRKGAAVIEGAVVPKKHHEAVLAVIEGLEWENTLRQSQTRSLLSLRLWKKFLQGLRIKERVAAYGTEPEPNDTAHIDWEEEHLSRSNDDDLVTAGEFIEPDLVAMLNTPVIKLPVRSSRRIIEDTSSSESEPERVSHPSEILPGGFDIEERHRSPITSWKQDGPVELSPPVDVQALPSRINNDTDLAGGFLVDEQERSPPYAFRSAHTEEEIVEHEQITIPDEDHQQKANTGSKLVQDNNKVKGQQNATSPVVDDVAGTQHTTDADKESRLSHDPEDDEADPDWLLSD